MLQVQEEKGSHGHTRGPSRQKRRRASESNETSANVGYWELKIRTLASLAITPNARAQQVQSDTEKRAHDLDLKYPGSTFTQVLKSHGKDGRSLVLVVGPFANLSDDFMVLCDCLGRARALEAINS